MSTEAPAPQAQPNPKSTDAETVRRVLSVREPVKSQNPNSPAVSAPKPPAR